MNATEVWCDMTRNRQHTSHTRTFVASNLLFPRCVSLNSRLLDPDAFRTAREPASTLRAVGIRSLYNNDSLSLAPCYACLPRLLGFPLGQLGPQRVAIRTTTPLEAFLTKVCIILLHISSIFLRFKRSDSVTRSLNTAESMSVLPEPIPL